LDITERLILHLLGQLHVGGPGSSALAVEDIIAQVHLEGVPQRPRLCGLTFGEERGEESSHGRSDLEGGRVPQCSMAVLVILEEAEGDAGLLESGVRKLIPWGSAQVLVGQRAPDVVEKEAEVVALSLRRAAGVHAADGSLTMIFPTLPPLGVLMERIMGRNLCGNDAWHARRQEE
jgi:hypothetical protein